MSQREAAARLERVLSDAFPPQSNAESARPGWRGEGPAVIRGHESFRGGPESFPGIRGGPESFPGISPTRPIRRLQDAVQDFDELAAAVEEREQALARAAAARPSPIDQFNLEVIAALAVYEAAALAAHRKVHEIEAARGRLVALIDRLVVEAYSKATLERRVERLQDERTRLEAALDCLVPEGRMHEVVIPRLARSEPRE